MYKNGASDQFGNHHRILILPVISKVVEKIVHNRSIHYLSEGKLLSERQFVFCVKRSTELAVTLLCDNIRKNEDSELCVFIDFSKAFDTISHAKLLQKLNAYGIRNVKFEWFSDYLVNRKQLVNYNNTLSESALVTCGVPQCSILGPLLFIIFVNDIVDVLRNSHIIEYADEIVIQVAGNDIEINKSYLSDYLNLLAEWFKEKELILSLKKGKTKAMIFRTAKRLAMLNRGLKVKYQHHTVNLTTSNRYVGVDIDPSLTFNGNFMASHKKATGRLHLLNKLWIQLDTKAAVTIYKSLIIPVLANSSVLSIFDNKLRGNRLKSIDSRATRIVNKHAYPAHTVTLPSIALIKNKHACMFVRKYTDGKLCENFAEYFSLLSNDKGTRNNSVSLNLPSVRTEFSKRYIFSQTLCFFFQCFVTLILRF